MEVQENMGFDDKDAEIILLEGGVVGRPDSVVWLCYVGIVRGHDCSLVLHRLPDRETVAWAPGPRPVSGDHSRDVDTVGRTEPHWLAGHPQQ
eukprot:3444548-Amphidinium_carterae.1